MKKKAWVFLLVFLSVPGILAAINILDHGVTYVSTKEEISRGYFNTDAIESLASRAMLSFGVSTRKEEVEVGKDGWLFLGDNFNKVYSSSVGRHYPPQDSYQKARSAAKAWDDFYRAVGAKRFYVVIAPNKHSIYAEFMKASLPNELKTPTDYLLDVVGKDGDFIDLRPFLKAQKQAGLILYYKTDTHWNSLGAMHAYRGIREAFRLHEKSIRWLDDAHMHVMDVHPRQGGDLARFLKLQLHLVDQEIDVSIDLPRDFHTQTTDYNSGEAASLDAAWDSGGPMKPMLSRSPSALNKKRVLWLTDSFGHHLSPFVLATFSDVLEWHHVPALENPEELRRLARAFRPEFVIYTMIERDVIQGLGRPWDGKLADAKAEMK